MSKVELSLDLMKDTEVDLIKDFLKIKGYKRTLECLIKEERYKNIENRNLKVISIKKYNFFLFNYIDRNIPSRRRKNSPFYKIYPR